MLFPPRPSLDATSSYIARKPQRPTGCNRTGRLAMDFAASLSVSSMKKIILLLLIQIVCATAAFAQSSPWKANNEVVPARPDLNVFWENSTKFPHKIWAYYLVNGNRLYPFLYLGAMVDAGNVKSKIGMACPLVDETKL